MVTILTHVGAKASYIYNPPMDRNELKMKDSCVPVAVVRVLKIYTEN
jgi:hypothetical protein